MFKNRKRSKKKEAVTCPYCGGKARLADGEELFGDRATVSYVWICNSYPSCDSYVCADERTKKPIGTLANKHLRKKRMDAHLAFDPVWQNGVMTRNEAYFWLSINLNLSPEDTHIGFVSEELCDKIINESKKLCLQYSVA